MSPETVQRPPPNRSATASTRCGARSPSPGVSTPITSSSARRLVTRLMIDAVAPAPGEEVLELACGAGGLGLAIADRVTPGGRVVLSDVAPEMVAIAAARAARRDQAGGAAPQVSAQVLDLEQIDLPDASFDIVVCREGLMFALDPARAASEIARVLRPGGRVAIAVWGPRDRNPWLGVLADAVQEHTGVPGAPSRHPRSVLPGRRRCPRGNPDRGRPRAGARRRRWPCPPTTHRSTTTGSCAPIWRAH